MSIHPDFILQNYNYTLPEAHIAQEPAQCRDGSKLLLVDKKTGQSTPTLFTELIDKLPNNALLVANNSRVIPARIFGTKKTGGKVEFLLLTPLPLIEPSELSGWKTARVEGLLKASKSPKPGMVITFSENCQLETLEASTFGRWSVTLQWKGDLKEVFQEHGHLPLPPYIKRPDSDTDKERYQTTYSNTQKNGSVAAPTAGLHFTPEIRQKLRDKGCEWAEVTLYVGYGTFSPVRSPDIRDHQMHSEYIEVPPETAQAVKLAKQQGRPVIAIGTTSARTLEGMYANLNKIAQFKGETNIFIYPGYTFNVIDGILTNFHLPESSLIIMISALVGREKILSAYKKALAHDFRFFSYGDAMLVI